MGQITKQSVTGTYTGSGAAKSITLGFRPQIFIAYNQTDHDIVCFFIDGMTADTGFKIDTATATIASGGATLSSQGVTLGTDAGFNEADKVYVYFAC